MVGKSNNIAVNGDALKLFVVTTLTVAEVFYI